MNKSNHLDDEPRDLDLSALTFDEFAAFLFARNHHFREAVDSASVRMAAKIRTL